MKKAIISSRYFVYTFQATPSVFGNILANGKFYSFVQNCKFRSLDRCPVSLPAIRHWKRGEKTYSFLRLISKNMIKGKILMIFFFFASFIITMLLLIFAWIKNHLFEFIWNKLSTQSLMCKRSLINKVQ